VRAQLVQDEIGHRCVRRLACVEHTDLDRPQDQFAQQRRHRDHGAVQSQAAETRP
jgi:hypothetical protein